MSGPRIGSLCTAQLKALGNGVIPRHATAALHALLGAYPDKNELAA